MFKELSERMKVISHCPIRVFVASYIPRYWYPYRLQHAGNVETWLKDESLEVIVDSGISDPEITNEIVIEKAIEANADYIIPCDVLNSQSQTDVNIAEFLDLYDDSVCRAKPFIPLQPPHDRHFDEWPDFSHYCIGGIASDTPTEQITQLENFRRVAGEDVYVHALGLGGSLDAIKAFRENPRLVDSIDLSTTEQLVKNNSVADKSWKHCDFEYPRGINSSTLRASMAGTMALQLNYMLSPFCTDAILEEEYVQSTFAVAES